MEIGNKKAVIFSIQEYPIKPVVTRGKYFKRVANSNHLMGLVEIANEHLKTINTSWDYYPDTNHGIEHISIEKVKRFMEKQKRIHKQKLSFYHWISLLNLNLSGTNSLRLVAFCSLLKNIA